MILRSVLGGLVTLLVVLAGSYVGAWRVKRRIRPAALLLDEGLLSLKGGLLKTTMVQGNFGGRPVSLLVTLGRWVRTLSIRVACHSPLDFTIWAAGLKGVPRTPVVDGYLVLAAPDFDPELASISQDSPRFIAWVQQPATTRRIKDLTIARNNWRLELRSGSLEWNDFNCRDGDFTGPAFAKCLTLLTEIASSVESNADDHCQIS
jgi:hypothetical protein